MRRLLLHFAAFALLVVTPAFASVPADSLAGVSISCRDARSGETLELRAQRLDSLGAIVANWADGSARACVGSMQDVATSFATDGTGGAFVVWVDMRTGEADLWIQHFTALGEPSPGWSESGHALVTATGAQQAACVSSDGAGGVIVVWQDYASGATADIRAQRVSGGGQKLWGADGMSICEGPLDQTAPSVAGDGAGGAFIFWQDARNGDADIRAAHVNAEGHLVETDRAVASGPGAQHNPLAVADGEGGVWLAWEVAAGADVDVRALRLGSDLSRRAGFSAEGVLVGGGPGVQFLPVIVPSDGDNLIVAWCDRALDAGDVRAQRLLPSGALAWPDSGRLVSTAPGEQYAPAIAADGDGGAIVAWED